MIAISHTDNDVDFAINGLTERRASSGLDDVQNPSAMPTDMVDKDFKCLHGDVDGVTYL